MKLAEALVLRSDTKKRLEQLRARFNSSALVQEGEAPPEDPQQLLSELEVMIREFERLVIAINRESRCWMWVSSCAMTASSSSRSRLEINPVVSPSRALPGVSPEA